MQLTSLFIKNFRNIESFSAQCDPRVNIFWGENGHGKTNLFEALYASIKGKSFRPYTQKADWLPKSDENKSPAVFLDFESDNGFPIKIEMRLRDENRKWSFKLNEKSSLSTKIQEHVPMVVFSPDDHSLIRGSPEERRDFLDDVYIDVCPGYLEILSRFEKTLKSRNALLKTLKKAGADFNLDELSKELKVWNIQFVQTAHELSRLRHDLWPHFQHIFLTIVRNLFEESGLKQISFNFLANQKCDENFQENLHLALKESLLTDFVTGWTHCGPQRDDFQITLSLMDMDAKHNASQGQARLLALALKWAHAEWVFQERRERPIFILDDFSSELDATRRKVLLELILMRSGQIFLSGTERDLTNLSGLTVGSCYRVVNGNFIKEN